MACKAGRQPVSSETIGLSDGPLHPVLWPLWSPTLLSVIGRSMPQISQGAAGQRRPLYPYCDEKEKEVLWKKDFMRSE